jgi:hypothetical protein
VGPHRVEVYVPCAMPRQAGKATLDVVLPPDGSGHRIPGPHAHFRQGVSRRAGRAEVGWPLGGANHEHRGDRRGAACFWRHHCAGLTHFTSRNRLGASAHTRDGQR